MAPVIRDCVGRDRPLIVWDLDGTLFDPRPRMLKTVHAFGRTDVELQHVHVSLEHTARKLELDHDAFRAVWHEVYWAHDAFAADTPMAETLWVLRAARALGIEPMFLTGRVEALRTPTTTQLARIGFEDVDVVMKASTGETTADYKAHHIAARCAAGDDIRAFVTDSVDEATAVRTRCPAVPCILVSFDAIQTDFPLWLADAERVPKSDTPVFPLGLPVNPWTILEIGRELNIDVSDAWTAPPPRSLDALHTWLHERGGREDEIDDVIQMIRRVACEHQLNDKEGRPRRHDGNLEKQYAQGRRFALPFYDVEPSSIIAERTTIEQLETFEDVKSIFLSSASADAALVFPSHPQGSVARAAKTLAARATASGRTLYVRDGGAPPILLKCHAPHLILERHPRALTLDDAVQSVRTSDAFMRTGSVCLFPEVLALGPVNDMTGAVVRSLRVWPASDDSDSYTLPAFCVWARASSYDDGPPLIVRMRDELGLAFVIERVIRPLIAAVTHLAIDLGCAFAAHGQNIHVEFGADGFPTGRVVMADMEDVWPHPDMTTVLQLPFVIDDRYRDEHRRSPESDIANAFQDHFVWRLLHPMLSVVEDLREDANRILRSEVMARAGTVRRFSPGPLQWFQETFLDDEH